MIRPDSFWLSGSECAAALQQLGLDLVRRDDGWSVLRHGARFIVVPDALALPPVVLEMILSRAEVSLDAVLAALDEIPTKPDLHALAP